MCNVDSASVFQTLDQNDIETVQTFIRTELYDVLKSKSTEKNSIYDDKYNPNFFGMFSSMRDKFQFMVGDTKKLNAIVDYVQKTLRESSIDYFDLTNKKMKKMLSSWSNELFQTPAGLFYSDEQIVTCDTNSSKGIRNSIDLEQNLLARSKTMFDTFKVQFPNLESFRDITEKCITVNIEDDGKCKGVVSCIFCHEDQPTVNVRVSYQNNDKAGSWILSNLSKHISKHHTSTEGNPVRKRNIKTMVDDSQIVRKIKRSSTRKNTKQHKKEISDLSHSNAFDDVPTQENNNQYRLQPPKKRTTLLSLKIEPIYDRTEINAIPNEDNEDLQDFFYLQLSTQNIQMTNAIISNKEKVFSFFIRLNLSENTSSDEIKCCSINGDGNCIFGSCAHQLYQNKINSTEHKDFARELRKRSTEFIEANILQYIHFLKGRIRDEDQENGMIPQKFADNSVLLTKSLNFVKNDLTKDGYWAGTESLRALSELHKINILIINGNGTCNMVQNLNKSYDRAITLAFRGNNHYDSVVGMSSRTILNFAKSVVQSQKGFKQLIESKETINVE